MMPIDLYLQVRKKEGRLYPDQVVLHLPEMPNDDPRKGEWLARADSADKLIHYLSKLTGPLYILELGCGNGWLSNKISTVPGVYVWGMDRSSVELTQAAHLFSGSRIGFLSTNIFQSPFFENSFDMIILASVIQYFPELSAVITTLKPLLKKRGEIHLLDSPIYDKAELASARERTTAYYAALGFPEMAGHYFHHSGDELDQFSPIWLYRPGGWKARLAKLLGKTTSPFPWIVIR